MKKKKNYSTPRLNNLGEMEQLTNQMSDEILSNQINPLANLVMKSAYGLMASFDGL